MYIRIDQPQTALEQYSQAATRQVGQIELLLGQARVHDALNDLEQGVKLYKQVMPTSLCIHCKWHTKSKLGGMDNITTAGGSVC